MKKLTVFWACLLCMAVFSVKGYAAELIEVKIAEFPIYINYEEFNTETASNVLYDNYQMFLYNDITYFPLSYRNCSITGLKVYLEDNILLVEKEASANAVELENEIRDTVFKKSFVVKKAPFRVFLNGTEYKNDNYPILFYKDIIYIPLTWQVVYDTFGWEISFDENEMILYTQSYYYISYGDSYFEQGENYTGYNVAHGKTYYCKGRLRIMAETTINRLGPNSQNLSVNYSDRIKYVVPGYTGHYQKKGPLFSVKGDYIYTVHYDYGKPDENAPCKINIKTGEITYLKCSEKEDKGKT